MKHPYVLPSLLGLLVALGTAGCGAEKIANAVRQSVDAKTVWVFAQFNVPEAKGIEDYFYYGRINEELYQRIIDGETTAGLIVMRDVRYWSNDDELRKYEDAADSGVLVFRIEHLVRLALKKGDPWDLERTSGNAEDAVASAGESADGSGDSN